MNNFITKVKAFLTHEEHRATVIAGTIIASLGEIHAQWPDAVAKLPQWGWLVTLENHTYAVLGVAVVATRVYRFMQEAQS